MPRWQSNKPGMLEREDLERAIPSIWNNLHQNVETLVSSTKNIFTFVNASEIEKEYPDEAAY